jgi:MATE family multidrug resistance protein
MWLLVRGGVLKLGKVFRAPSWRRLKPLLVGGAAVQLRALALNMVFLAVTRRTQTLDATGTLAAAHAITIQLWQLGGVVLFGLSGAAAVMVPSELGKAKGGGKESARSLANRLLAWGLVMGVALGFAQLAFLPLLAVFSPLPEVQKAAVVPSLIGAALQSINGLVFIGEGIMQGTGSFKYLAGSTLVATAGMLLSLDALAKPVAAGGLGLNGVWACFFVFNAIRLAAVALFHFRLGPLAVRNLGRTPPAAS